MPSPFPGMDPFIEGQRWASFHDRLVVAIGDALVPQVRPRYIVDAEERACLPVPHRERETFLTLRDRASHELVTVIEVLSPSLEDSVHALEEVDRRLADFQKQLKPGDALIITADHGCDLSRPTPGHSREYVPLLITGPKLARGVNLGARATASDLGQTIGEALGAAKIPVGDSFLDSLRAG